MTDRARVVLFVLVAVLTIGGVAGYVWWRSNPTPAPRLTSFPGVQWLDAVEPDGPVMLYTSTLPDQSFKRVAFVRLNDLGGARYLTSLRCERVAFRKGSGVCLDLDNSFPAPYTVRFFNPAFHGGDVIRLTGVPTRARVSHDGALAATTVFESGHSYAVEGFSTRTNVYDARGPRLLGDLEQYTVLRDGKPFTAVDFNFWGVTFIPGSRAFFATLGTGGKVFLVRGDVDQRIVVIQREGVECPSLSPDGTRIAFKAAVEGAFGKGWHIAVLDLATSREVLLGKETRSVDDQVEWLDDDHVLYAMSSGETGADVWALRVDNSEAPKVILKGGYSPAIVREWR